MRSVFISSSGDPFVLLYSLSFYPKWINEVDEVWLGLNSTMPRKVMAELLTKIPKSIKVFYVNKQLGFGKPLELLLSISQEGNVLLLEDDAIIFKKGVVDKYFTMLENGIDLIGSPRMSCPANIASNLKDEFGLNYEGRGDKGPMFWPNFLWVKKELLLKTDRNFDPTNWGDTFAWMSVQLRRLTRKILEIPQYHCSPDDYINKENGWGIFDGECKYMHLGSLSSGIQSYLLTDNQVPLADLEKNLRAENPQPIPNTLEMHRRIMWWRFCAKQAGSMGLKYTYLEAVKRAKRISGANEQDLENLEKLYKEVIYGTDTNS